MSYYCGIDLGGTNIKAGVVDGEGKLLNKLSIKTNADRKMEEIIHVHYGDIDKHLISEALNAFYKIREMKDLQKRPSTSELLDWIQALMISGVSITDLYDSMPFLGVLLKKNQDIDTFEEIKTKGYSLRNW